MLRCSKNKNINESTEALPKSKTEDLTKCTEIDENDGTKWSFLHAQSDINFSDGPILYAQCF